MSRVESGFDFLGYHFRITQSKNLTKELFIAIAAGALRPLSPDFSTLGAADTDFATKHIDFRRLHNITTVYDPQKGIFKNLFATVIAQFDPHVKIKDWGAADSRLDVCCTVFVITGRSMTLPEQKTLGVALIGPYLTPHQI